MTFYYFLLKINDSLELSVFYMKMRRIVIIVKHLNDDPVKS